MILARMTATVCGYSFCRNAASTSSLTLPSFSHMVRPAGPRISSIMTSIFSLGIPDLVRSRSVESCVPTRALVEDIWSAKSTNRRSITVGEILPRLDMV